MNMRKLILFLLTSSFLVVVCSPAIVFFYKKYSFFELTIPKYALHDNFKLEHSSYSPQITYDFIQNHLKNEECALTFRLAEVVFYQSNCVLSYADSRMVPFYKSESKNVAIAILKKLNIRFIIVPNTYGMAEINHSMIENILADQQLTRLVQTNNTLSTFEILSTTSFQEPSYSKSSAKHNKNFKKFDEKFSSTILLSDAYINKNLPPKEYDNYRFKADKLIKVKAKIEGKGFYRIDAIDYNLLSHAGIDTWSSPRRTLIWEGLIDGTREINKIIYRKKGESELFRFEIKSNTPSLNKNIVKSFDYTILDFQDQYKIAKTKSSQALAQKTGWMLDTDPQRNINYIDWGEQKSPNHDDTKFWLNSPNDRHYLISNFTDEYQHQKYMKISSSELLSSSKLNVYIQWLNSRTTPPTLASLLRNIFYKKKKTTEIEKMFGKKFVSRFKGERKRIFSIEDTQILGENSGENDNFSYCIPTNPDSNLARLAIHIAPDSKSKPNTIINFETVNFKIDFYNTQNCE